MNKIKNNVTLICIYKYIKNNYLQRSENKFIEQISITLKI